ncbi:ubiquitin-like domain-containing protein [Trichonephila inaurata madagascariensis]|uniref:Ubiquitin-like domain-containing protein n=1 Tax=Trichonephila inaurata madagascariensis TaxID=2747483 RepID=A0A8X7BRX0_9ARAC|nr:ubiquitin-like domain-containing protein [Trichonephila inaurata madagascariensis]
MASNIPSQSSKEPPTVRPISKKSSTTPQPIKTRVPEPTDNSDRIFIEVLRKQCHYILDVKLDSTAEIIKRMIEGISRFPPENQQIHFEGRVMGPTDTLKSIGITKEMASLQKKFVQLGLAIKEKGVFEKLEITPVSELPELPEVFKEFESELDPKAPDTPPPTGYVVRPDDGLCKGASRAAEQIAAKRAKEEAAKEEAAREAEEAEGTTTPSPAKITKR